MPPPPPSGERRHYTDRRADSPKLREWFNGISRLGQVAVALVGALGASAAVRGVVVTPVPPDTAALTARVSALEVQSIANTVILSGLARQLCLNSTDQQVVYSQIPCDSLMRGIGGWRSARPESLRSPARP